MPDRPDGSLPRGQLSGLSAEMSSVDLCGMDHEPRAGSGGGLLVRDPTGWACWARAARGGCARWRATAAAIFAESDECPTRGRITFSRALTDIDRTARIGGAVVLLIMNHVHTFRRGMAVLLVTLLWVIVTVAVSGGRFWVIAGLEAIYLAVSVGVAVWWARRTRTARGVQRQLRRPGDEVKVRIGWYGGALLSAWDPARQPGPRNGVFGPGYGTYQLEPDDQVTLTWHPVGGQVRELTGPRTEPAPSPSLARARRMLLVMFVVYLAILAMIGTVVGLVTGRAIVGILDIVIAMCVLPLAATAARTLASTDTK